MFSFTFEQGAAAIANGLDSAHGVAQPVTELDNLFGILRVEKLQC